MRILFGVAIFLATNLFFSCTSSDEPHALIKTNKGDIEILLYNSTPIHRDNFIKLINENFYDSTLFHRVIKGFMIQGGDPDSRKATRDQFLGKGGPGYLLDAEIGAPHLRGAVAAARIGGPTNPEKKSSGSQFYIVQGSAQTDESLSSVERLRRIKYNPEQRQLYKELGGAPQLDNDYTVFGEVVKGMDVVDAIAELPTDAGERPLEDVRIEKVILLNWWNRLWN